MDYTSATDPYARVKAFAEQKFHLSPVSLLQEALVMLQISPQYELVNNNGPDHTKTFTYEASLKTLNIAIQGTATTKKEAKTLAASNLIKYMCDVVNKYHTDCSLSAASTTTVKHENMQNIIIQHSATDVDVADLHSATESIPNFPANVIGSLQELCVQKGWSHPKYIDQLQGGVPHKPVFTTSCSVLEYTVSAVAGNKRTAKKKAAEKMWAYLLNHSLASPSNNHYLLQPEQIKQEFSDNPDDFIYEANVPSLANSQDTNGSHSSKILPLIESTSSCSLSESVDADLMCEIQESLQSATGPDILKLKIVGISKNNDHKRVLYDLCQEQAIRVGLVVLDERTADLQEQCMIQLIFPSCKKNITVIFNGMGDSTANAEQQAAYNALFFIKMMTNYAKIRFKEMIID